MNKTFVIYGLHAEGDDAIRYVGVTRRALERRLSGHLYRARKGERTHKGCWIRSVLTAGGEIRIIEIEATTSERWVERERFHIASRANLTNECAGGEGLLEPSADTRARMRAAHFGKPLTAQHRANLCGKAPWNKGKPNPISPETVAKIVAKNTGKTRAPRSAEWSARIAAANRGRVASPETRARMSASRIGKKRSAEQINKWRMSRAGYKHSDETKRKISITKLARAAL